MLRSPAAARDKSRLQVDRQEHGRLLGSSDVVRHIGVKDDQFSRTKFTVGAARLDAQPSFEYVDRD